MLHPTPIIFTNILFPLYKEPSQKVLTPLNKKRPLMESALKPT